MRCHYCGVVLTEEVALYKQGQPYCSFACIGKERILRESKAATAKENPYRVQGSAYLERMENRYR